MSYTGAWRRDRATRSDGSGLTVAAGPLGHPELAELHMNPVPDTEGSRPPWAAVDGEEVPAYLTDLGRSYDLDGARAPGLVLTTEPTDDHDAGVSLAGGQSYAAARAQGHAARSVDRGAAVRETYRARRIRASDEVRTTAAIEVEPISGGSRVFALRGDNSLPENNPDGFRNGLRVQRWTERRIPGTSRREHNAYPARTRTARGPNVSPAAAPGEANRYASPYGLNQLSRTRVMASPMARRTPRAWDEDVVTDGAPDPSPSYVVWGL
jgi:hypothetical protein